MLNPTNIAITTGNLAAAPRVFTNDNGTRTVRFVVFANSGSSKYKDDRVEFVAFLKEGQGKIYDYLNKGDRVSVASRLTTNEWTDKHGEKRYDLIAVVNSITKLDSKRESEARAARGAEGGAAIQAQPEAAQPATQPAQPAQPMAPAPEPMMEDIPMDFDFADFQ